MKNTITWFNQAWFQLIINDLIIYIDPVPLELNINLKQLPPADLILITHEHYDHFNQDTIKQLTKDTTLIIGPQGCQEKLQTKIRVIKENESYSYNNIQIKAVPAYNLNKEFHPPQLGVGYLISFNNTTIYHAGDTDLIKEMKFFKPITIALLPIGGTYTMDYKEAVKAVTLIKPKLVIPMHYLETDPNVFANLINTKTKTKVKVLTPTQPYNINML